MPDRRRWIAVVVLSTSRAREGILVKASLVFGLFMIVAALPLAALAARSADVETLGRLPVAAAAVIAWAAGVLVAFSASTRALVRDRADGIVELLAARGIKPNAYVVGRSLGLSVVLFALSGGGAVSAAIGEALTAGHGALRIAGGLVAGLVFALMFALSVAPLSLAALGARSRSGGYFALLLILGLPELLVKYTNALLPEGWGGLLAVPSALAALASALSPGAIDLWKVSRAFVVLAVVAAISLLVTRAQLARAKELAS